MKRGKRDRMNYKKYRKGVFCVVYALDKKQRLSYLLLHRKLHWKGWEFCKGGKRFFETYAGNARREVKEETGLSAINLKQFIYHNRFAYDKKTQQEKKLKGFDFLLFACQVKRSRVKICQREHDAYKWLSYNHAIKLLKWPNQKRYLKIVHKSLKK